MKSKLAFFSVGVMGALFLLDGLALAQGGAFTYQGRLDQGGQPANGWYDLTFTLFNAGQEGSQVAGPVTNNAVPVGNGAFSVAVDFGPGVFSGQALWLELGVRTNGGAGFTALGPRQGLLPTPYAHWASVAGVASNLAGSLPVSQLSGTVSNGQLAYNSLTVKTGAGLSGGGPVALGGETTLTNTGVLSIAGSSDLTVSNAAGNVSLGIVASSQNAAGALVRRDGNGNFAGGSLALSGALSLPGTTPSGGVITQNGNTLLHAFGPQSFFAGPGAGNLTLSAEESFANTGLGATALQGLVNGYENTAVGCGALFANTNGGDNTACGVLALNKNSSGCYNTAAGCYALLSNSTGGNNSALGWGALYSNLVGSENTAGGTGALYFNTNGLNNTALGAGALYSNVSGSENTASGRRALYSNVSGLNNTAVGAGAFFNIIAGSNNVALGWRAGRNLTNGSSNIYLGSSGGRSNEAGIIRIGTTNVQTNAFIAGIYEVTAPSGLAVYVNASGQLGTLSSSRRFKQEIQDLGAASEVLLSLRPVSFRYKPEIDPAGTAQFGLIAEEVEQVAPELVARDEQQRVYTVRYEAVNAMLLNEFLKQHGRVQEQAARLEQLQARAAWLEQRLEALEKRVTADE